MESSEALTQSPGLYKESRLPLLFMWLKKYWLPTLLLMPAAVLYGIFFVYPAINSIFLSFFDWNMLTGAKIFEGFDNYTEIFKDPVFIKSLINTAIYAICTIVPLIALPVLFSVLIERCAQGRTLMRALIYIPAIISMSIAGVMWKLLFNPNIGFINLMLKSIGIQGPNWLSVPELSMFAVVLVGVWRGLGTNTVLFIAGLKSVSREQIEASRVDGANWWSEIIYIILPSLGHVLLFVLISTLISAFQVFTVIQVMTSGGPNNATNMLVYQVWEEAFRFFDMGRSTAISSILFVLLLIMSIVLMRNMERSD